MNDAERCPECGSWSARCASDVPVVGCGCVRCAAAENARLRRVLESIAKNTCCPPCQEAALVAREALNEKES